jgi:hypothetical protein
MLSTFLGVTKGAGEMTLRREEEERAREREERKMIPRKRGGGPLGDLEELTTINLQGLEKVLALLTTIGILTTLCPKTRRPLVQSLQ